MRNVSKVFLKKNEDKEILEGFPWVYDNEIDLIKTDGENIPFNDDNKSTLATFDGTLVEVFSFAGNFLGSGVINTKSKITIRLFEKINAAQIYEDTFKYFQKKISDANNVRRIVFNQNDSYRLIFGEADFIPGFICDRFCTETGRVYLVVQFLSLSCEVFKKEIIFALQKICAPYAIYERSDADVRTKEGLTLTSGWIGKHGEEKIIIKENHIRIEVDLARGQKTGYFLDQKFNRERIKPYCHGKAVLDAFSHTGAFGLNAFKAGARSVVCADISQDAITTINHNITLNDAISVVNALCVDVFDLLKKYEEENRKFDVIILDPPAFTKSAKNIKKAYGGYKEINLRAMRLLNEGGILVTCSCSYFFDSNTFYSMLTSAAKDSHKKIQVLEKLGAASDHPILLGYSRSEYLKCAIARVL